MATRKLRRITASIAGCSLILAACGASEQDTQSTMAQDETKEAAAAEPASTETGPPATGPAGPTLTPAYLEGRWCFLYTDLGQGHRKEQGVAYVFGADGTLSYQRNGKSGTMDPGSYAIDGDMIDLRPMFMVYDLRIDSVEDDEFVLKGLGRHHFIRGACPEPHPIDESK